MDETLLHAACAGKLELVKALLCTRSFSKDSFLSEVVKTRYPCFKPTPLSAAAEKGHAEVVEELVDLYREASNFECGCPLHVACFNEHATCVGTIVSRLPHLLNEENEDGLLPIHIAAKTGNLEVTQLLLQAGVDVNKSAEIRYVMHRRYGSYSALYMAASRGHTDVVKALLNSGASPLMEVERDESCLGLMMSACTSQVLCPLSVAAYSGHIDTLKILSEVVPLDKKYGTRAVVAAATRKQVHCLQYLLEKGAPSFNFYDIYDQRSIWMEILCRYQDDDEIVVSIVKILLHHDALQFFAAIQYSDLIDIFIEIRKSLLKFLLDSGTLERRYCHTYAAKSYPAKYDTFLLMVSFQSHGLLQKLNIFMDHYPFHACIVRGKIYDLTNVPSLCHLSRWRIRQRLVAGHKYISKELISELPLPPLLQRYLFFCQK